MATKTTAADTDAPVDTKPDPVGKPVEPEKVTVTDIPPREPYPTGGAPDPEDAFFAAHGFRRAKE